MHVCTVELIVLCCVDVHVCYAGFGIHTCTVELSCVAWMCYGGFGMHVCTVELSCVVLMCMDVLWWFWHACVHS